MGGSDPFVYHSAGLCNYDCRRCRSDLAIGEENRGGREVLAIRVSKPVSIAVTMACMLVLVLASCSADGRREPTSLRSPEVSAENRGFDVFVVNSDLSVGRNFLVLAIRASDGSFRGSSDSTATIEARPLGEGSGTGAGKVESFSAEAPFIRVGSERPGTYGTRVNFSAPGQWEILVRFSNPASGGLPDGPVSALAVVAENSQTPSVGDAAPRSRTKTLASEGGDFTKLTSDYDPDPGLYTHSLDEVIGSGVPVVVMFATPLRCKSATCGPALQQLKRAKAMDPAAFYIHVDVYERPRDPSDETYVQAVKDWRLPTEPMTFVITAKGNVYDRFEGMFLPEQLVRSIEEARIEE